MWKCPQCGKTLFPDTGVTHCAACSEELHGEQIEAANRPGSDNRAKTPGMHWLWAFLIMASVRWLGGQMVIGLFAISPYNDSFTGAFIGDLLVTYMGLYIWLRLTTRRYMQSILWAFFTYLWYIVSPIYVVGSYGYYIVKYTHSGKPGLILVASLCGILGTIYLIYYRSKVQSRPHN